MARPPVYKSNPSSIVYMTVNRYNDIDQLMQQAVSDGVFPGGVLLAAREAEVLVTASAGRTSLFEGGKKVAPDTVFDLASLTKPLATALAVMRLASENTIDMSQSIRGSMQEACPCDKAEIVWAHLLCHTSGLPDYRPYFEKLLEIPESRRKPALRSMILDEPLLHPPGSKTVYSDVGFLLLQFCIEAMTGKSFPRFIQEDIYPSVPVSGLFFPSHTDPPAGRFDYAATEVCSFRGLLQGVVHDENAFAIGGAAGHAGLFGTAEGVYRLLQKLLAAYLGLQPINGLRPEIIARFFRVPKNAQRPPGFDVPSQEGAGCGRYFSKGHTVGHLGFTGTSFWMDLERKIIVVLLTNRVHPNRENEKIKKFRSFIHDEVMQRLLTRVP